VMGLLRTEALEIRLRRNMARRNKWYRHNEISQITAKNSNIKTVDNSEGRLLSVLIGTKILTRLKKHVQ
jgi:hypothetical protein